MEQKYIEKINKLEISFDDDDNYQIEEKYY